MPVIKHCQFLHTEIRLSRSLDDSDACSISNLLLSRSNLWTKLSPESQCVAAGSGDGIAPVIGADPMEIGTDGAGTVFGGQPRQDRLVVEIMDPGRKTIGSTSLAEMGVNEDAALQEV